MFMQMGGPRDNKQSMWFGGSGPSRPDKHSSSSKSHEDLATKGSHYFQWFTGYLSSSDELATL